MSPLSWIKQDDYAAGTLRSIGRDQDVGIGVWNSINGMYDDDGDVYLRGPTQFYSKNRLPHGLTFLWSGVLTNWALLASTQTKLYGLSGYDLVPLSGTALTRPVRPAVIKDEIFLPNGVSWKGGGTTPQENQLPPSLPGATGTIHLAACAGRLVVGQGRFVRFSGFNADGSSNAHQWSATDYHELPEGTVIAGLAAIHDTLLVFTSYGVWAIHNLALDLTDDTGNPQHVVSKIIPELALLHESGLTEWAGSVIAPCTDRCYMIDVDKAPVPISDSIAPLYAKHIRARRLPGGAKAFRNHLFLPGSTATGPWRASWSAV